VNVSAEKYWKLKKKNGLGLGIGLVIGLILRRLIEMGWSNLIIIVWALEESWVRLLGPWR